MSGSSLRGCFLRLKQLWQILLREKKEFLCHRTNPVTERTNISAMFPSHLQADCLRPIMSAAVFSLQITLVTLRLGGKGNSPFSLSSLNKGADCLHVVQRKIIMSHCRISFQRVIYLLSSSSTALLSAVRPGCEQNKNQRLSFWIRALGAPA